jgi:hypothetical protein
MNAAHSQQSHWATPDDKTAKFMIDMERKWAEGVCTNNGVVSELLADDFQGTSTRGERYNKADELRDEKGPHSAHGCALDDAKVRFFGEDVAIIYGSEHAIGKDKTRPDAKQCQVWTDTWLKRDGKWQIAAAQDNKVDCKYTRSVGASPATPLRNIRQHEQVQTGEKLQGEREHRQEAQLGGILPLCHGDAVDDDGHRKSNGQPAVGLPNPFVPIHCVLL